MITLRNRHYQKSYPMLLEIVNEMFPPITDAESFEATHEYNDLAYWRLPMHTFPDSDDDAHDSDYDQTARELRAYGGFGAAAV